MRVTKSQLGELVNKTFEAHRETCHLYVVMRYAHTERELLSTEYEVKVMVYEWPECEMAWETDWWEGEKYIDLWGIYTDEDFVKMATKGVMLTDGGESS